MTQINRNQLKNDNLTGASFHHKIGIYNEMTNYAINDSVFWLGVNYKCVASITGTIEGDLSNSPDVSSSWIIAQNSTFSCFPSRSQSFTSTRLTLYFDTIRMSDGDFNLNSGEITFLKSGTYIICIDIAIDNFNSGRSGANGYLQIDTGSGYSDISNYMLSTYNRNNTVGESSASLIIPVTVNISDKIRLQVVRFNGYSTLTTVIDGCNMTIFNNNGQKGVDGEAGGVGPAGPSGDLDWQGSWVTGTTYYENDVVEYNGSSFICIISGTTINPGTPSSPNTGWNLVAKIGTDGAGSSMNINDSGTALANTPHGTLNFTGDISAVDSGGGIATINVTASGGDYILPIWAASGESLGTGRLQWSFGHDEDTPINGGVCIYVPTGRTCSVVALSIKGVSGTATIEMLKNGIALGSNCNVSFSTGTRSVTSTISPAISLSNNDYINFKTTVAGSAGGPCTITAWLKYV